MRELFSKIIFCSIIVSLQKNTGRCPGATWTGSSGCCGAVALLQLRQMNKLTSPTLGVPLNVNCLADFYTRDCLASTQHPMSDSYTEYVLVGLMTLSEYSFHPTMLSLVNIVRKSLPSCREASDRLPKSLRSQSKIIFYGLSESSHIRLLQNAWPSASC